jgi:hypothetical protein
MAKSGKRIMVSRDPMRDIALFRPSVTSGSGKKKDRGNDHSQSGVVTGLGAKGDATKLTHPCLMLIKLNKPNRSADASAGAIQAPT